MTTMKTCRIVTLALALISVLSAACAARAASTTGVPPAPEVPEAVPEVAATPISAEAFDTRLAKALAELAVARTPEGHLAVAAEYRRLGIFDDALDHLTAASKHEQTRAAAMEGLARLWRDAGQPGIALGHAHRAVAGAPTAPAYNTLGTVLTLLGWLDAGREAFTHATMLDPSAAYAWNNLCYSLFLDTQFDRAAEACKHAVTLDSGLAAARNNLALVHAGAGRLDQAAKEFDRVGDQPNSRYNMGLVFLALGQYDRAAGEFEVALRLRPSFNLAAIRAKQARALAAAR